ncbi:MAG: hypothetical protein WCD38_11850 [Candidatus Tumulicola sp.]
MLAVAPGSTTTISAADYSAAPGLAITAASNNANVATVSGGGVTPGPVTFTVSVPATAFGSALITFTVSGVAADSGGGIPVAVIPQNPAVPQGLTSVAAINRVRKRTNLVFGQPPDADVLDMLNDGLEQTAALLDPILVNASLPIVSPNTNVLALPLDVAHPRDINFSTGNPTLGGTVVYEMVQMDYDTFIQFTDSTPTGGIGGIPSFYSLIQDASGAQLIQFYPYANSGQLNIHYYPRPTLWTLPTGGGVSYTNLDSAWQTLPVLYACALACENREDAAGTAEYYWKLHGAKAEEMKLTVRRRARKRGTAVVRDVSAPTSILPNWMR